MSKDRKIAETLAEYGEDFNTENVWRVQGTPVISHKVLERIAARAGIQFDLPTVLRCERDEAVMLVAGTMKDRREWSIGEALVNVNYRVSGKQAAYVYAMAEKRAKDRVILKLIELHGLVYSEDESDDFKAKNADRQEENEPPPIRPMTVEHMLHEIEECPTDAALGALKADLAFRAGYKAADELSQQRIKQALAKAAEGAAA